MPVPAPPAHYIGLSLTLDSVQNLLETVAVSSEPVDLLRQHGVQVTAQRLAVFRAVGSQPHMTADALAEIVRGEIGTISRQSVYDSLAVLVDVGLVRRIQPAGSPALFEDRVDDNHHHLICRTCGRVVDVDCAAGYAPCLTVIDDKGYEIDEAEVAYWGQCPECLSHTRGANAQLHPTESVPDTAIPTTAT